MKWINHYKIDFLSRCKSRKIAQIIIKCLLHQLCYDILSWQIQSVLMHLWQPLFVTKDVLDCMFLSPIISICYCLFIVTITYNEYLIRLLYLNILNPCVLLSRITRIYYNLFVATINHNEHLIRLFIIAISRPLYALSHIMSISMICLS